VWIKLIQKQSVLQASKLWSLSSMQREQEKEKYMNEALYKYANNECIGERRNTKSEELREEEQVIPVDNEKKQNAFEKNFATEKSASPNPEDKKRSPMVKKLFLIVHYDFITFYVIR